MFNIIFFILSMFLCYIVIYILFSINIKLEIQEKKVQDIFINNNLPVIQNMETFKTIDINVILSYL